MILKMEKDEVVSMAYDQEESKEQEQSEEQELEVIKGEALNQGRGAEMKECEE